MRGGSLMTWRLQMSSSGSKQPAICNHCRQINPAESQFCNLCGNPIDGAVDLASESRAAVPPPPPPGQPAPGYGPGGRAPRSKVTAVFSAIGLFLFLTPVLLGVGAFGGCIAMAVTGQEIFMTPAIILGLIASIAISVTVFRSMSSS